MFSFIIGAGVFMCVLFVASCIVSVNSADKELEDREQMEYLKEWSRKHVR